MFGGRLFLTRRDSSPQTGHHDDGHDEQENTEVFAILTEMERSPLWLLVGPHFYVHDRADMRRNLARLQKMEGVEAPEKSVFIGHECVQLPVYGWNGIHCLWYHIYILQRV